MEDHDVRGMLRGAAPSVPEHLDLDAVGRRASSIRRHRRMLPVLAVAVLMLGATAVITRSSSDDGAAVVADRNADDREQEVATEHTTTTTAEADSLTTTTSAGTADGDGSPATGDPSASPGRPGDGKRPTDGDGRSAFTAIPSAPIEGRGLHVAVWTGDQMLVWGGQKYIYSAPCGTANLGDGAMYDPRDQRWVAFDAPADFYTGPCPSQYGFWTGTRLLVHSYSPMAGGSVFTASFDPASRNWRETKQPVDPGTDTQRWSPAVVWTGSELVLWGGMTHGAAYSDGLTYNPVTNSWARTLPAPIEARHDAAGAWTGKEVIVVGGVPRESDEGFSDGAAYDPTARTWRPIADAPFAGAHTATWTGSEVIAWGGRGIAAYDPRTDRWRALTSFSDDLLQYRSFVWTGRQLQFWPGAALDPADDTWRALPPFPVERGGVSAVWTGEETLLWGGVIGRSKYDYSNYADGYRYAGP